MFKKLYETRWKNKLKELPEEVVKEIVPPCDCESYINEHCDLISKLRYLQKMERDLKKDIDMMEKDSHELIFNFVGLLKSLENNGLIMNDYNGCHIDNGYSGYVVKRTLNKYSYDDIFRITEELKTYKLKDNIIIEKRKILTEIQKQIKDIKDKLGIE